MTDLRYPTLPNDWLLLLIAPFIGSFLGVVISRLPQGRPVGFARSACDSCGAQLCARDLLPLVSYAWLRGRCRHCGSSIGWFHPIVELVAVGIAAWVIVASRDGVSIWIDAAFGWSLVTLSWIDARCRRLPDVLTLPLILAGLAVTGWHQPAAIADHAMAAALAYAGFRLINWCYRMVRHRDGLGAGDAKLLAGAGAWLGVALLPATVLIAAISCLLVAGLLALSGRTMRRDTALPFGPFIALALWLLWLHYANGA